MLQGKSIAHRPEKEVGVKSDKHAESYSSWRTPPADTPVLWPGQWGQRGVPQAGPLAHVKGPEERVGFLFHRVPANEHLFTS